MSRSSFKKLFVLLSLALSFAGTKLFAQQLTRFAVVDTEKVYQAYFKNTAQLRTYEQKKAEFQREIDTRTDELLRLQQQKSIYQKSGDTENAASIQSQIAVKTQSLKDYISAKNVELETLKESLTNNDAFYQKLYSTIERIAENGGYSMVLNLQDSTSIIWFSPSVDITDQVITALGI